MSAGEGEAGRGGTAGGGHQRSRPLTDALVSHRHHSNNITRCSIINLRQRVDRFQHSLALLEQMARGVHGGRRARLNFQFVFPEELSSTIRGVPCGGAGAAVAAELGAERCSVLAAMAWIWETEAKPGGAKVRTRHSAARARGD